MISQSLCLLWEPWGRSWGDGITKCTMRPGPGPLNLTWGKSFQLPTCSDGLRKGELEGSPSWFVPSPLPAPASVLAGMSQLTGWEPGTWGVTSLSLGCWFSRLPRADVITLFCRGENRHLGVKWSVSRSWQWEQVFHQRSRQIAAPH